MKLKKMAALFAVATTVAVVAGCSSSSKETTAETTEAQTSAEETTAEETTEAETEEEEEENYNTGDASKDNPRNQDEIGEDEPEYHEAKRLLKFLEYFLGVGTDHLPNNSIVREFAGGSCFPV